MRSLKIPWLTAIRNTWAGGKIKPYLVDGKYRVIPAFKLNGVAYYMYENPLEIPAGRFMASMSIHVEMEMKCDKQYLLDHTKAVEKILNPMPGKPINLTWLAQANINLKERLELMPNEDAIYKFASVIFFDETESPHVYDQEYAKVKIEKWKASGGTLGFFSQTPLRDLIPALTMPEKDMTIYLTARKLIEEIHRGHLGNILSDE